MKSFVNKSKWAKKVGLTTEHDSVRPPLPIILLVYTLLSRPVCVGCVSTMQPRRSSTSALQLRTLT